MPALQNNSSTAQSPINGVVVILLFDFLPQHRSWAWLKLMWGTSGFFKTISGLLFAKIMGSGEGGGFGLRPSSTHQGLIFVFDGIQNASDYLKSQENQIYREKSRESWQGILQVNSCRGTWDGQGWQTKELLKEVSNPDFNRDLLESQKPNQQFPPNEVECETQTTDSHHDPYVASLTRGSIRASKAVSFWRYAPPAQEDLHKAAGCELAMGLGEAPLLRQCTFSLWRDTKSLIDYAQQGAHLKAIAAAKKNSFFTESMFVRMKVLHMHGDWMGKVFNYNSKLIAPYELCV